jgi:hypothetical protein
MTKRAGHKQPAGQMPRHDCHGVHPNQTHEEWLASMKEKQANLSNMFSPSGKSDLSGFLGDLGIGGAVGGGATVPTSIRSYLGWNKLIDHPLGPGEALASDLSRALTGKSVGGLQLSKALRRGGKGALIGGGIAGLLGLILNRGGGAPFSKLSSNQFGGGTQWDMNNKISSDKQAGLLDLAGPMTLGGALLGGGYGAYKAPKGARPEGFGRGAYRGMGAGLGATAGIGIGGLGGGLLGQVISNALHGRAQAPGDKRYLPALLALLGAGLGGYGGGKLGYRAAGGVTGDYAKLDKEEEEEKEAASISDIGDVPLGYPLAGAGVGALGRHLHNLAAQGTNFLDVSPHPFRSRHWRGSGKGALIGGGIAALLAALLGRKSKPTKYGHAKTSHHVQLDFKSASFSDDINEVRAMEKKSSLAVLAAIINALRSHPQGGNNPGPGGRGWEGAGRGFVRGFGTELGAGIGGLGGLAATRHPIGALAGLFGGGYLGNRAAGGLLGPASYAKQMVEKASFDKQANLAKVLGGLGSALGHGIGGGAGGWARLVGKGLKAPGFLPKATAVAGGGLSIAALNEMLASTRGSFLELPHIGMGSDHPMWDPMMHHDRIDPKKTGFKSLLHMATRPLQTAAVLTGMAKKPSGLADYARAGMSHDNRLSAILNDPKNFKIDPITGRGTATGEVPFSLDSTLQEQISDFNQQRERLESMGIIPRRSGSRSTSGRSTHTRPFRGRFD